jgi:hypothetical protein
MVFRALAVPREWKTEFGGETDTIDVPRKRSFRLCDFIPRVKEQVPAAVSNETVLELFYTKLKAGKCLV